MNHLARCFLSFFFVLCISGSLLTQAQELFVGLSEINITPPIGYPHYRGISTGVHDTLYAKAIYFRQGDQEAVLVECDLLWISRFLSTDVRLEAQKRSGIPFRNMIIAGTHSHTSPAYDEDILELNEHLRELASKSPTIEGMEYHNWLRSQIVQGIVSAKEKSGISYLEMGSKDIKDLTFNRRYMLAGGRVQMNPGTLNPAAVQSMGPADPEVGMLLIRNESYHPAGMLVNFALHTDTKGGTEFSADFPFFLSRSLSGIFGEEFTTIYGQGACGDLNHIDVRQKKQRSSEEIGQILASAVEENLENLQPVSSLSLAVKSEMIYVPLQNFTKEELAWAQDRDSDPFYDESAFFNRRRPMKIRSLQRIREKEAVPPTVPSETWHIPLEVQVIRLSDEVAIVGLPGELFTEHGLMIKAASPFTKTMVIELTNSHIAYVPTKEAFKQGSYETINSRLAPGGGEMLVEKAVELLRSLK